MSRSNPRKKKPQVIEEEKSPLNYRLHKIRQRIWGAGGIASSIEYASDSMLAPTRGKPDITNTAAALYELLTDISGDLEDIVDETGGAPDVEDQL